MFPYEVLFGQNPPSLQLPLPSTSTPPDPGDYSCQLRQKLMEMWEMVDELLDVQTTVWLQIFVRQYFHEFQ